MRDRQTRVLAYVSLFLLGQLAIIASGRSDTGFLCDDAYYYFQVARDAATGHGFSFDGIHATNGWHPLYGWLCVPIFALFGASKWLPIRIALGLLATATSATGWVVYRAGRVAATEAAGELMAALFLLSPFNWILPLRGCEGGLSVLCLALCVWQMCRLGQSWRDAATLGALLGLAGLARTENVLFAIPVAVWLLWRTRSVARTAVAGGAALVVVAPWLIWNLATFGTIVQVSGAAKKALDLYGRMPEVHGVRDAAGHVYAAFENAARFVTGEEWTAPLHTGHLLWLSAGVLIVALLASRRLRSPSALVPLYAFVALHLGFYALYLRAYYNWYFMPVVLGLAVLEGERLARARWWIVAPLVAASAAMCAWALLLFTRAYPYAPHTDERWAASMLRPYAGQTTRVGLFNAGRVGYFAGFVAPGVRVVNLDCVVNNELFAAWEQGGYGAYVLAEVDWLAEPPSHLAPFLGADARAFAHAHLARVEDHWRVIPDAAALAPPPLPAGATVIADFESSGFTGWTVEGDAFQSVTESRPNQTLIAGYAGQRFVASIGDQGDANTGRLVSPPFVIDAPHLSFLIGGGNDRDKLRVSLIDENGKRLRDATGKRSDVLERVVWDVGAWSGRSVRIEIVDASTASWGHVLVDEIALEP